jgi:hypothetical protein
MTISRQANSATGFMVILLSAFLSAGCVTRIPVLHDPLEPLPMTRTGMVRLRPFTDLRPHDPADIGTLRNILAISAVHVTPADQRPVNVQLTAFWADALRHAGYQVVNAAEPIATRIPDNTPMLEGDIDEFWMDTYFALWHDIQVRVRLRSPTLDKVLWERTFRVQDLRLLWLGTPSEYADCITAALNEALNCSAREFASEDFARFVHPQ